MVSPNTYFLFTNQQVGAREEDHVLRDQIEILNVLSPFSSSLIFPDSREK